MDPASLTFGVVSLAMQLMQTTAAIQELIATYKSAAKEISSLSDKLDDIEAICRSLEAALNCYEQTPKPWDAILLKKLHKIMTDCRDKVSRFHSIISSITPGLSRKRRPFNTMGILFLQYRGTIRQCNEDLDQSLRSLQLHMTTNLLVMNLRPPMASYKPVAVRTVSSHGQGYTQDRMPDPRFVKPQAIRDDSEVQIKHWKRNWHSVFYLEQISTRRKSAIFNGSDSVIQDDVLFLAGSFLFGLFVKLCVQRGCLSPLSVSIQFPHVLDMTPGKSKLGDRLWRAFSLGRLKDFQTLFSDGLLMPSTNVTLDRYESSETSLYGMATMFKAYDICQFLQHQIPDISQRLSMPSSEDVPPPFEVYGIEGWAFIITQAVSRGLDVHTTLWPQSLVRNSGFSALYIILEHADTTKKALDEVQAWLKLLEKAGIEIQHYLEVEIQHCASSWGKRQSPQWIKHETLYSREFAVQESGGRWLPCLIEKIADSCSVRELFTEFPHLKQESSFGFRHVKTRPGTTQMHLAWKMPKWKAKYCDPGETSDVPSYPFYPPLDRGLYYRPRANEPSFDRAKWAGLDRACDLMDSRFERKQAKRRYKAGYTKRLEFQSRMPGAWVDE
ncbi:hypothetical protein AK830_g4084 [Neonectria ditissima]|uniref:Azaphilone pigments biosynthesis cluster protein L N-terminal domain-containing protein n=1 Tax=Neonectria ditissima TaxID=78410 RepID=A0A0P7B9Q4_9HYPO|nr:hypothetical protein AK830_g4084 [Neonectria ditissima]